MKSKFKVGEIVRQIKQVRSNEDPICKIVKIKHIGKSILICHKHREDRSKRIKTIIYGVCQDAFKPLPKLLRILYDF